MEFAICFILSNSHSDIPNRYFKFLLFLGKYLRHKTSGLEVVVTHLFLFCFVFCKAFAFYSGLVRVTVAVMKHFDQKAS